MEDSASTTGSSAQTSQLDNEKMLEWLSRELEPICEADPDVLAKYVLALLKHEANNSDLQSHCVAELRDFLRDYTEDFVISLFEAIDSGSYKLPPGSGADETFVDEEDEDNSLWNRRRRTNSDEEGDREAEDSFKRRRYDEPKPEGEEISKVEEPQAQHTKNEHHQLSQRYDRRDGRGFGRNGHHHDRRMDSRGYGRGMQPMMGMGYGSEPMYGRGPNVRGQMYHGHGPGYGRMDPWMGGMPNMYPQMMGMPMNPMMGSGGMYDPPPQGWPRGPPSQMPRVNALLGMNPDHQSFEGGTEDFHSQAPFEESATLKCTGIPRYVKEAELYTHFAKFGKVVKLNLKRFGPDDPSGMDQKAYNECLVQFDDPSDCRKCLSSPMSVLNNRFIKIFSCPHNIVSASEVSEIDEVYPGAKKDEENGLWAAASGTPTGRGRGRMAGRGRGRWTFGGRDQTEQRNFQRQDSSTTNDQVAPSSENGGELSVSVPSGDKGLEVRIPRERPSESTTPTAAQLEKERLRGMVQQKYDDLKNLRHKAETIWKQKEDLLQGQIDQYRTMRNKLQSAPGGEDKVKMMDTIEEKIMSLQSQLQEVRQQRESGVASTPSTTSAPIIPGRGRGRGREMRGRGRALRGRGRGRFVANKSLDLRSKAIILSNPPAGFVQSAHQHFSRHGHVLKITPIDNDQGVIVHFATRRDAENAFNRGTNYLGQLMKIDWYEDNTHGGAGSSYSNQEDGGPESNQGDNHVEQNTFQEANEPPAQHEG